MLRIFERFGVSSVVMAEKQCYDAFRHSDEKDAIQKLKKMKGDPREIKYNYHYMKFYSHEPPRLRGF